LENPHEPPYMSKWKQQALGSDRPDVDPSLLRRFNDFGQLQALRANELQRAALLKAHHPSQGDVAETGRPEQRAR
jgi:hypothetical protein